MWLKLTKKDGRKELFNMAQCINIEPDPVEGSRVYMVEFEHPFEVEESFDELAQVLNAQGKL